MRALLFLLSGRENRQDQLRSDFGPELHNEASKSPNAWQPEIAQVLIQGSRWKYAVALSELPQLAGIDSKTRAEWARLLNTIVNESEIARGKETSLLPVAQQLKHP